MTCLHCWARTWIRIPNLMATLYCTETVPISQTQTGILICGRIPGHYCTHFWDGYPSCNGIRVRVRQCKYATMAHLHCTGPGLGQGPENDGFLNYAMYCAHYRGTRTGTGNHCFLLYPSRSLSLSLSQSHATCRSQSSNSTVSITK